MPSGVRRFRQDPYRHVKDKKLRRKLYQARRHGLSEAVIAASELAVEMGWLKGWRQVAAFHRTMDKMLGRYGPKPYDTEKEQA